jgi:ABC-type phosphate/phosphonate transport system permease subunit
MESFKPVIEEIQKRNKSVSQEKVRNALNDLVDIFMELDRRQLATEGISDILKRLKGILIAESLYLKQIVRLKTDLLSVLRKQYGLVTPKYYQTLWMVLGMTMFGIPFGTIFSTILGNFAFSGIGLAFGLPIGLAIGIAKDKKAEEEGLVLKGTSQPI